VILELDPALRAIIVRLLAIDNPNRDDVNRLKFEICREFKLPGVPSNSKIISNLKPDEKEKLLPILRRKETRAASGVNVVAVMTEPRACPHGRCAYCPGGPDEGVPQSYTGHEPAAMRGVQNKYDPFMQVTSRVEQLKAIGHEVDKVDLIVMGGTFPAAPPEYQEKFIKGCLDALNGTKSTSFSEAKKETEESTGVRNVGITVETRPDCVKEDEINAMLNLGVTRVELGVQNVYDDIYERVDRGHTVEDVVKATQLMKDAGLKIVYHMMPGLPGSSIERDIEGFRRIFEDPHFKPDMIKIYPTLVIDGTKLKKWWIDGEYTPLSTESAVKLISEVKRFVPPWVRIMRVQRDIPAPLILAGVKKGHLRQLVKENMKEKGDRCRCIRCREVGHRDTPDFNPDNVKLKSISYEASGGVEYFISAEDSDADVLIGFVRLRVTQNSFRPEADSSSAFIRELHVYGQMVPVGQVFPGGWQHRGWGGILMVEGERLARLDGVKKLLVTSALGTKAYYARLGYKPDGVYVSKML